MEGMGRRRPRVCVTGAGGFAASWLVKLLLSKGYLVHGTVRDPSDEKKYGHLKSLENATENLKLYKADLLNYDSIASAVAGCDGVFHVASPVPASNFSKQENWYQLSKTVAEKEAIDFASKNALDVITICPTVMFGPMLQSTINSSNWVIINLLRDALLLVYEKKEASGRYIASADCITTSELIDLLKRLFPNYSYPENITEPKKGNKLSSEKLRLLGWRHRPLEETLKDAVNYYRDARLLD